MMGDKPARKRVKKGGGDAILCEDNGEIFGGKNLENWVENEQSNISYSKCSNLSPPKFSSISPPKFSNTSLPVDTNSSPPKSPPLNPSLGPPAISQFRLSTSSLPELLSKIGNESETKSLGDICDSLDDFVGLCKFPTLSVQRKITATLKSLGIHNGEEAVRVLYYPSTTHLVHSLLWFSPHQTGQNPTLAKGKMSVYDYMPDLTEKEKRRIREVARKLHQLYLAENGENRAQNGEKGAENGELSSPLDAGLGRRGRASITALCDLLRHPTLSPLETVRASLPHCSYASAQIVVNDAESLSYLHKRKYARADKDVKRIQDFTVETIDFERWLVEAVIDTPPFQRLRELCQLGACKYVYPSANHTRFEHSLGVCNLGGRLFDKLRGKLCFSYADREIRLLSHYVAIAGLCHDIGHGPYSHTFEEYFLHPLREEDKNAAVWRHEDMSIKIIDYIVENCNVANIGDILDETGVKIVKTMIAGLAPSVPPLGTDVFECVQRAAYDIISNKRNGLDVDRFDYLHRDALMTNLTSVCSGSKGSSRIIDFCGVVGGEIVYNDKEIESVWNTYSNRHVLFKKIYTHKKVRALELMLCDAFRKVNPIFRYSDAVHDVKHFLTLSDLSLVHDIRRMGSKTGNYCDFVCQTIGSSTSSEKNFLTYVGPDAPFDFEQVVQAKALINNVTSSRNGAHMYRYACGVSTTDQDMSKKITIAQTVHDLSRICNISDNDIIVDWNYIHWGMGEENPFDHISFYPGHDETAIYKVNSNHSVMYPSKMGERELRVYCTKNDIVEKVKIGFEQFLKLHNLQINHGFPHFRQTILSQTTPSNIKRQTAATNSQCVLNGLI